MGPEWFSLLSGNTCKDLINLCYILDVRIRWPHELSMKCFIALVLFISTSLAIFAAEPGIVIRKFDITYEEDDFRVPAGQIWKLSWESPYEPGEVRPAYDVRVQGEGPLHGPAQKGQIEQKEYSDGMALNVIAGKEPAEIYLRPGVKFAIANTMVKVTVTAYAVP